MFLPDVRKYIKQEAMENFVFPDEIVKNDWKFENIFPIP